ncbi:MAG: TolC family protein [Flavisolibacter sp.]
MIKPLLCLSLALGLTVCALSQDKWDLRRCVEYALANNISVKQQDVQARLAALTYNQSKLAQYPSATFSGNTYYTSGRYQNPVSFGLSTQSSISSGYTLQAGADLFNWFSKRNATAGNLLEYQAASANVDKLKDDISLNVAGAYLQALLSKQQVSVSLVQISQTTAQLENTRKLVNAGNVPELNLIQLEAQLATDSSNLITAQGNETQAMLLLKAYLNLDAGSPFQITTPNVESIPLEKLSDLQPEAVYDLALQNLPQQRVNDFHVKAAEKFVASARASMYPTFSLFGVAGTNYFDKATKNVSSYTINPAIGTVNFNNTDYLVYPVQPFTQYNTAFIPYFEQLNQNIRQQVGISLSIPIANGGVLRTNYNRSKLTLLNYQLQRQLDNQTLKQNIYKAYNDVLTSMAKYNASGKTVLANEKAYDFATKRYNAGLLNTIDLITTQNNLFSARLQQLLAQFDYVFKMKVLEFYKGQGIKL